MNMCRIFLVLCLGLAGCDARSLAGRDGGAPEAATVPDVLDPAETSAVCSSPSICNEDPNLSTLAGTCTPFGDTWYCACNEGFSYNNKTGRCRAGTACVAAGADTWATSVSFDTSDCASRPAACQDAFGPPPNTVENALFRAAMSECRFPTLLWLRIVYDNGCVVSLQTRDAAGRPASEPFLSCFTKLVQSGRWSCPEGTGCALLEWDTLP